VVKIASWNVNSVKARLAHLLEWLGEAKPDIVLLQELKCVAENFPAMEIEDCGYNVAVKGQKAYNGVAILSKTPLEITETELPGDSSDEQARYIEAVTDSDAGFLRIASIYLPNGNPVDTEKFPYKLAWMERLVAHAENLLRHEEALVLAGDYNVIPADDDVYSPEAFAGDALTQPGSRAAFRRLLYLGFTDAFRALHSEIGAYTFWDYQAGAWQKDNGLRIDHLLLSPQAADLLVESGIDRKPRGKQKASDHTPIWCGLEIPA
jgi:exodeoxyribonuclease-3